MMKDTNNISFRQQEWKDLTNFKDKGKPRKECLNKNGSSISY